MRETPNLNLSNYAKQRNNIALTLTQKIQSFLLDGLCLSSPFHNLSGPTPTATTHTPVAQGPRVKRFARPLPNVHAQDDAMSHLKTLAGRQRHARLRQLRFQLVEHRRAQAGGHVPCHALHHAPDRVSRYPDLVDALDHSLCRLWVRAADDVRLNLTWSR